MAAQRNRKRRHSYRRGPRLVEEGKISLFGQAKKVKRKARKSIFIDEEEGPQPVGYNPNNIRSFENQKPSLARPPKSAKVKAVWGLALNTWISGNATVQSTSAHVKLSARRELIFRKNNSKPFRFPDFKICF